MIVVFLAVTPARMVRITSSKDKNVQIPGGAGLLCICATADFLVRNLLSFENQSGKVMYKGFAE